MLKTFIADCLPQAFLDDINIDCLCHKVLNLLLLVGRQLRQITCDKLRARS